MAGVPAGKQRRAMYQTILVPFDGSPLSARALPIAAALAKATAARLHVALVHDPSAFIPFIPGEVSIPVYDAELESVNRREHQEALDVAVAQLTATGVDAVGVLLEGTVLEALLEHAKAAAVDLTVMSTHGRSGFARLRLGSVAAAYLTRATAPVYMVRGAGSEAVPEMPTGTLLCPVDGSAFSEAVIPHAARFAQVTGLTMALLAVVVPHAVPMAPFGAAEILADGSALAMEEAGHLASLQRLVEQCPAGTTVHAVTDMSVSRRIIEEATRLNAGAIAMATHGRGGFKRLLLGSVADEVLRHTHTPVLVYRPSPTSEPTDAS
jgi:nucleotide-binding universal stress UspA family protein